VGISTVQVKNKVTIDTRLDRLIVDHGLHQFVTSSTKKRNGNMLDLVIAKPSSVVITPVTLVEISFSDHNLVTFAVNIHSPKAHVETFNFRNIKSIDIKRYMQLNNQSTIVKNPPSLVEDFLRQFDIDVKSALDELAPLKRRTIRLATRPTARWLSEGSKQLKMAARRLHRRFRVTDSNDDYVLYRNTGRAAAKAIKSDRQELFRHSTRECHHVVQLDCTTDNPKSKWRLFNELLHTKDRTYISSVDAPKLAVSFTEFFTDKDPIYSSFSFMHGT